ncbi:Kelch-like protein 5 [Hordeum vulgare]|nr:Kelch-like protein 5 [Hordeum vulgare]
MQQIFSFELATCKHAMGSGHTEGLHVPVLDRNMKWACFMTEELTIFTSMTRAVKAVAIAIKESKIVDVYPELYNVMMDQIGFKPEALMVALNHLLDNKAQGVCFISMGESHRVLWLRTWLGNQFY